MSIRTRLLEDHKTGCFAAENTKTDVWSTPWAYLERMERRDRIGRRSGPRAMGDRWWYVRCNDPDCPAAITVNERDLLSLIGSGV